MDQQRKNPRRRPATAGEQRPGLRQLPKDFDDLATGKVERLRRPRRAPEPLQDEREGAVIPGVRNSEARTVYDARVQRLRQLVSTGDESELRAGLEEARRLALWRARNVTDFRAFSESVVGATPALAQELAEAAQTETAAATWPSHAVAVAVRAEAALIAHEPGARVQLRDVDGALQLTVSLPLTDVGRAVEALSDAGHAASGLRRFLRGGSMDRGYGDAGNERLQRGRPAFGQRDEGARERQPWGRDEGRERAGQRFTGSGQPRWERARADAPEDDALNDAWNDDEQAAAESGADEGAARPQQDMLAADSSAPEAAAELQRGDVEDDEDWGDELAADGGSVEPGADRERPAGESEAPAAADRDADVLDEETLDEQDDWDETLAADGGASGPRADSERPRDEGRAPLPRARGGGEREARGGGDFARSYPRRDEPRRDFDRGARGDQGGQGGRRSFDRNASRNDEQRGPGARRGFERGGSRGDDRRGPDARRDFERGGPRRDFGGARSDDQRGTGGKRDFGRGFARRDDRDDKAGPARRDFGRDDQRSYGRRNDQQGFAGQRDFTRGTGARDQGWQRGRDAFDRRDDKRGSGPQRGGDDSRRRGGRDDFDPNARRNDKGFGGGNPFARRDENPRKGPQRGRDDRQQSPSRYRDQTGGGRKPPKRHKP